MSAPLARVLSLLEVLQSGGVHTLATLSQRLGVDERTARRYIGHLVEVGIPVESIRGRYGGYRVAPGFRLPPLMLTDDEALAVLVALATPGINGEDDAASAAAKILRVLPPASRSRFEALLLTADLEHASSPPRAARDGGRPSAPETPILLAVADAAGARRPVRIRYEDRDGRGSHRIVLPYGIVARAGRWYVVGADSLSGEVRTFRVDRIRSAEAAEGAFEVPRDFDAADRIRAGIDAVPWRYEVSVRVEGTAEHVLANLPAGLATVHELDEHGGSRSIEGWVRVEFRAERLEWVPAVLAGLDRPFLIDAPEELRAHVRTLGERLVEIAGQ